MAVYVGYTKVFLKESKDGVIKNGAYQYSCLGTGEGDRT